MLPDPDGDDAAGPIVPAGVHLAPISRRVLGLFVDELVVLAPVFAVFVALGHSPADAVADDTGVWFGITITAVGLLYETVAVWRWGRTVGKLAAGTRVVHAVDGGRVDLSAAFIRSLVPATVGAIPQAGPFLAYAVYLLALVDPRRQGLHDKAAGTLVALNVR